MCEEMAFKRVNLSSVLEVCETHHKRALLPLPNEVIQRLVGIVFRDSVSVFTSGGGSGEGVHTAVWIFLWLHRGLSHQPFWVPVT